MEWLRKIIDRSFEEMSMQKMLMTTPGDVPHGMLEKSSDEDWKVWKPMDSIITDEDINRLEEKIQIGLPKSYREFLKYKHFYDLFIPDRSVNLIRHLPDKELYNLYEHAIYLFDPEFMMEGKYIYFADFHDYGLLCFDANKPMPDNEYQIVYIDHEDLNDIHVYANNFQELLEADREKGNRFIAQLNTYHRER